MECEKCNKTFAKSEYLKKHNSRNPNCDAIDVKPDYVCPTCMHDFSSSSNAKQDYKRHMERKTSCLVEDVCLTCPKCLGDFSGGSNPKQDFKKHMARKTSCAPMKFENITAPSSEFPTCDFTQRDDKEYCGEYTRLMKMYMKYKDYVGTNEKPGIARIFVKWIESDPNNICWVKHTDGSYNVRTDKQAVTSRTAFIMMWVNLLMRLFPMENIEKFPGFEDRCSCEHTRLRGNPINECDLDREQDILKNPAKQSMHVKSSLFYAFYEIFYAEAFEKECKSRFGAIQNLPSPKMPGKRKTRE